MAARKRAGGFCGSGGGRNKGNDMCLARDRNQRNIRDRRRSRGMMREGRGLGLGLGVTLGVHLHRVEVKRKVSPARYVGSMFKY